MFPYNASCKTLLITGATTTQVFSGNGRLVSITINQTTAGTIGIIDGTTGTTVTLAQIAGTVIPQTLWYNAMIAKGLRIINASAENITVTYILDNQ